MEPIDRKYHPRPEHEVEIIMPEKATMTSLRMLWAKTGPKTLRLKDNDGIHSAAFDAQRPREEKSFPIVMNDRNYDLKFDALHKTWYLIWADDPGLKMLRAIFSQEEIDEAQELGYPDPLDMDDDNDMGGGIVEITHPANATVEILNEMRDKRQTIRLKDMEGEYVAEFARTGNAPYGFAIIVDGQPYLLDHEENSRLWFIVPA